MPAVGGSLSPLAKLPYISALATTEFTTRDGFCVVPVALLVWSFSAMFDVDQEEALILMLTKLVLGTTMLAAPPV